VASDWSSGVSGMLGHWCAVRTSAGGLRRANPQSVGELSAALWKDDNRIGLLSSVDVGAVRSLILKRAAGPVDLDTLLGGAAAARPLAASAQQPAMPAQGRHPRQHLFSGRFTKGWGRSAAILLMLPTALPAQARGAAIAGAVGRGIPTGLGRHQSSHHHHHHPTQHRHRSTANPRRWWWRGPDLAPRRIRGLRARLRINERVRVRRADDAPAVLRRAEEIRPPLPDPRDPVDPVTIENPFDLGEHCYKVSFP